MCVHFFLLMEMFNRFLLLFYVRVYTEIYFRFINPQKYSLECKVYQLTPVRSLYEFLRYFSKNFI